MHFTILICTHNRVALLNKTLASINRAYRPANCHISLLVVANACTDDTHHFLNEYIRVASCNGWLPLDWVAEPTPGKSHALNCAIPLLSGSWIAFVDDDHRVDTHYLVEICNAAHMFPEATLFCGRIMPDWRGREPKWVHDNGPYRIYPLPVPRFDHGENSFHILDDGPVPGGGNLIIRREVFSRIGSFSTELGPYGHNLRGGEDIDFVLRAREKGELLVYVPEIIQYHFVDQERLSLPYLLRKSYQRSCTGMQARNDKSSGVPLYLWRKLFTYFLQCIFSLSWARTRFYLVRLAAVLGEVSGALNRKI
ncbi:glycosyltransferase family 2 protein [Nitrosococcus wardiae]|uniref:Glycosyltransferase n=1 Tax=Nitrosococcus wardiae TaxID=1814290 RepID=A0A4P7BX01_9GAMM|nr:glycosyltransferase [Nitrosococcus wardiae]QBQ54501.1 glycosyltransferase [Nitrosococcus wardiae]